MQKPGACLAIAALSLIAFTGPPTPASALRIGPFHLGVPFAHRHHHHRSTHEARRSVPRADEAPGQAPGQTPRQTSGQATHQAAWALLYPSRALPTVFQNVFWPAFSSPWPFGYESIFATAFASVASDANVDQCRQSFDANAMIERLRAEIGPNAEQMEQLQRLGGAMGAAAEYLAKACPANIPEQPTTRLQVMDAQIEILTLAIDMIHQPLQSFEQSLTREQETRFSGPPPAPPSRSRHASKSGPPKSEPPSCGGSAADIGWSIDQIDRSVQPTEQQRAALGDLQQAFGRAARDLQLHCPTSIPPSAVARLEAIEARLDSTWRAILSIQVALHDFENNLTDEQKTRFKATTFAWR
jgi:hypothetical protein